MENKAFKTHMIYIDYPMNSLNLKEMEDDVASLEVNLGDLVIVDCQGMDYICSSGLRVFLGLYKMIAQKGGKLIIRNLQPLVKNVFDMSGFSQIFSPQGFLRAVLRGLLRGLCLVSHHVGKTSQRAT